ncbi:MAG: Mu transposase C-terminal domain-containing protein [Ornithinimicrobium sp.]|uniref:Mu transposase C-terminal domain-containing protein n=1 Tax=Ornithinimicrobium sp. TaxID=1977084 RepID=UPI003D9BDE3D
MHYFSNALRLWVARRAQLGKFVIRRDPRDISRVWVLEREGRVPDGCCGTFDHRRTR